MTEDSNTANNNFPIHIERYGWGCLMIVPLSLVCLAWVLFIFFVWYTSGQLRYDLIGSIVFLVFALLGVAIWFFGSRSQYNEKIEISQFEVSYHKEGFLRKTKQWKEPTMNYKGIGTKVETGIEKSGVESETEVDLFVVILVHASEKKKNVILEKNADDKNNQLKIQQHYAQLLKLPALM